MKEELFNKIAERLMHKWDAKEFKKTHPRLLTVILESMEEYASVKNNDVLSDVSQQRELLIAFAKYMEEDKMYARHDEANVDDFLENHSN